MAFLFLLLLIPCASAVFGWHNVSKITFWVFLIILIIMFKHHVTDALNIQL